MMRPAISVAGRGGALLPGGRRAPTASRHERRRGSVAAGAGVRFTGVGRAVPDTVISNDDLAQLIDTNDEWISTRTGIRARRVLGQGEKLADLASEASRAALEMAGVEAEELDLILFATSSADDMFGSASQVQAQLGNNSCIAFDITAACSGFVVAAITASQFIKTGAAKNVLIIGADALSRYVDWRDRGTCILFGDGTGAMVMQAAPDGQECAMLGSDMHTDGKGYCSLYGNMAQDGLKIHSEDPSALGAFNNISMKGQDVFKFAARTVPKTVLASCEQAGVEMKDLDWLVCHQANQRILDSAADRLGINHDRVVSNLASYGNTSAASIPIAFAEAVAEGKIQPGQTVAIAGFGAGLTYASAIIKWG
eukprot:jgi/Tetstr1/454947/TSEL_041808.t1